MNRRTRVWMVVVCLSTVAFVAGCPGEDALIGGIAGGLSDGIAAIVQDLVSAGLER